MPVNYNPNTVTDSIEFLVDAANNKGKQKANLLYYSQEFNQSSRWKTQDSGTLTITADAGISPIGDGTATKLDVNATGQEFGLYQDIPSNSGAPIKFSLYFKNINISQVDSIFGGTIRFSIATLSGTSNRAVTSYIDASTGAVASPGSSTFLQELRVFPVGNGWYRLIAYYKAGDSGDGNIRWILRFNQGETGSMYIWGAQATYEWTSEDYIRTTVSAIVPSSTNSLIITQGSATESEINVSGIDKYLYVFNQVGNTFFLTPDNVTNVEYLLVAGGGAGGGTFNSSGGGGGGGAGGVVVGSFPSLTPGQIYSAEVGAGGVGTTGAGSAGTGGDGQRSYLAGVIAVGGGGGGNGDDSDVQSGRPGGSGGGSGGGDTIPPSTPAAGTSGQGNAGGVTNHVTGDFGSGGGGASQVGESENTAGGSPDGRAGKGGDGTASSITGTSVIYAGGGGGGSNGHAGIAEGLGGAGGGGNGGLNTLPTSGTNGLGGGGGGAGGSGSTRTGANGGSGVVILRYNKQFIGKIQNSVNPTKSISPVGACALSSLDSIPAYKTYSTTRTDQSYLELDESIVFNDQASYSMNFWVKLDSDARADLHSLCGALGTGQWLSIDLDSAVDGTDWFVRYRDGDGVYRSFEKINNIPSIDNIDIRENWTNICVVVKSNRDVLLYVNGMYIDTQVSTNTLFTVRALAGGYSSSGNYYALQGSLGMASFYRKELSADEVYKNFYVIKGRFGL